MYECRFSYKDKVTITEGFYRGFSGVIETVKQVKDTYEYSIQLENIKKTINVKEEYLKKKLRFKIPFLN